MPTRKELSMKSSWGNVKIVRTPQDVLVYGQIRKKYTRSHPPTSGFKHDLSQPRIKATLIKLTQHGYSINQLANAFGRSTSFVHKCVRTSILRGIAHFIDKRKLPSQTRLYTSSVRRKNLSKFIAGWIAFAKGEVDKPP